MGLRSCLRSSRAGDGSCLTLAGDSACSARAGDIGVGEGARTTTREVKHGEAAGQVRMGTGCNGCGTACATGFAAGFMDGGIAITLAPGSICTGRGACGNTMGCFGRGAGTGGRTM